MRSRYGDGRGVMVCMCPSTGGRCRGFCVSRILPSNPSSSYKSTGKMSDFFQSSSQSSIIKKSQKKNDGL